MTAQEELFLFAIGMVNFLALLLGLTTLLSIARQVRIRLSRQFVPTSAPSAEMAAAEDDTVPALGLVDSAPTKPSSTALEELRSTMRTASSEPVTFFIEPDAGPTHQQRTIQRLIEYLKEESSKTAAPVSPV